MKSSLFKIVLLVFISTAFTRGSDPFSEPIPLFSDAFVPILNSFEKASISNTPRGFIARGDSASGFSAENPSEAGLLVNVAIVSELKGYVDHTGKEGTLFRRLVQIPGPQPGGVNIEVTYGKNTSRKPLMAINECIDRIVGSEARAAKAGQGVIIDFNDNETITPIVFHDAVTDNYFYVESDGRHITAFTADGKLLWHRNPFVDAHLEPYRCSKPMIKWIGRDQYEHKLAITFSSSQFGFVDEKTGEFQWQGQD